MRISTSLLVLFAGTVIALTAIFGISGNASVSGHAVNADGIGWDGVGVTVSVAASVQGNGIGWD